MAEPCPELIRISIVKWAKFNPRSDVKNSSWYRQDAKFLFDPKFASRPIAVRLSWIAVCCLRTLEASEEFDVSPPIIATAMGLKPASVFAAISELERMELIKIHGTSTVRARDVNGSRPSRARDEDDTLAALRDGTGRDERITPPLAPPQGGAKTQTARWPSKREATAALRDEATRAADAAIEVALDPPLHLAADEVHGHLEDRVPEIARRQVEREGGWFTFTKRIQDAQARGKLSYERHQLRTSILAKLRSTSQKPPDEPQVVPEPSDHSETAEGDCDGN